tara:strand:- start:2379 stop:4541 length:2163 start_codon:yes stop_codon:yes gene_type:complete
MQLVDQDATLSFLPEPAEEHGVPRTGPFSDPAISGYLPRVRQWVLRLLCDCGVLAYEDLRPSRILKNFPELFAINESAPEDTIIAQISAARQQMPEMPLDVSGPLSENLNRLTSELEISRVELDVLALMVIGRLADSFEWLLARAFVRTDPARLAWQLAQVLGYSRTQVEWCLSSKSLLMQSGLMRVNYHEVGSCISDVLVLNRRLTCALTGPDFNAEVLLQTAATGLENTDLRLDNFEYLGEARDLAVRFLRGLQQDNRNCGSILLDGPPGVGKSEFARLLAQELGFNAFGINELDRHDEPATPLERMQFLRMAQRLVSRRSNGLLVFDEADGLLQAGSDFNGGRHEIARGSLLQLIESLHVPVIWITNHASSIHPAILRRIDLALHFPELPASAREAMLLRALPAGDADREWLEEASRQAGVTPARIAQAERVAAVIGSTQGGDPATAFRQVLEQNVLSKVRNRKRPNPTDNNAFVLPYRPELINADQDLGRITDALQRWQQGRVCLYGPPGSGKTRYVHHLAQICGLKVSEYRASDLLHKYLGQSEKAIHQMFVGCDRERQLLFLDEADSLIRARTRAEHAWEVSQTNEFLKELEEFDGLFVASTNLPGELDSAVMRRLDFKLHFGYLKPDQRWRLFLDLARHLEINARGAAATRARRVLGRVDRLTPGDFAMLARRLTFDLSVKTALELAKLVKREAELKPDYRSGKGIGFTATIG